jgi:hypothetical protein
MFIFFSQLENQSGNSDLRGDALLEGAMVPCYACLIDVFSYMQQRIMTCLLLSKYVVFVNCCGLCFFMLI